MKIMKAKTLGEVQMLTDKYLHELDVCDDSTIMQTVNSISPQLITPSMDRGDRVRMMLRVAFALGYVTAKSGFQIKA